MNIINLDNRAHLGDNLFTCILFYNIKDYIINNNIQINYYLLPEYINEIKNFIPCDNIKLLDIKLKPNECISTWIGSKEELIINNNWIQNKYFVDFYNYLLNKLNINILISKLEYIDNDLLSIYSNLDYKYKNIDILIINSTPLSGQYDYDLNIFNNYIKNLNNLFNIVTTKKIDNINCTLDNNLNIKEITAISINTKVVIAINTGPLVGLFNNLTFKSVKKFYIFDKNQKYDFYNFQNIKNITDIDIKYIAYYVSII